LKAITLIFRHDYAADFFDTLAAFFATLSAADAFAIFISRYGYAPPPLPIFRDFHCRRHFSRPLFSRLHMPLLSRHDITLFIDFAITFHIFS
jgi:hypothetical protein